MALGSKDSISNSTNHYNNIFDVRNTHGPKSNIVITPELVRQIDSMQKAGSLEQQVMARLNAGQMNLSDSKLIILARAGKYLFIAMALPPYIFFYGIPKWILMTAIPETFKFLYEKVKDTSQKLYTLFVNSVSMMGNMFKYLLIEKTAVTKILEGSLAYIKLFKEKIVELFMKPIRMVADTAKEIGKFVKATVEKALDFVKNKLEQTASYISNKLLQPLAINLTQPIANKLFEMFQSAEAFMANAQQKFERFQEFFKNLAEQLTFANIIRKAADEAKEAWDKMTGKVKDLSEALVRSFTEIGNPVAWLVPRISDFSSFVERTGVAAKKSFVETVQNFKKKVQEFSQVTVQIFRRGAKLLVNFAAMEIVPYIMAFVPLPLAKLFGLEKFKRSKKKRSEKLSKKVAKLFNGLKRKAKEEFLTAKKGVGKLAALLKKLFYNAKDQIINFPANFFKAVKRFWQGVKQFIGYCKKGSKLAYVWGKVLFKNGLIVVGDLADYLGDRLAFTGRLLLKPRLPRLFR